MKEIARILFFCFIFLTGCASNVKESDSFYKELSEKAPKKMGVVATKAKQPELFRSGVDSLYSSARVYFDNQFLQKFVNELQPSSFAKVINDVAALLRDNGFSIEQFNDELDLAKLRDYQSSKSGTAKKDFSKYKNKGVDLLLVLESSESGILQNYSGHIPQGEPSAVFRGQAFVVDLETNTIIWRRTVTASVTAPADWETKPDYPILKHIYGMALEQACSKIEREFLH